MFFINDISLKKMPASKKVPYQSEIIYKEQLTKKFVPNVWLEKAIGWQDKFLLFLTDDCPFEEYLTIILLDSHFNILDKAVIGCIYSTGHFKECEIEDSLTVKFEFIGGTTWRIKLLDKPSFHIPYFGEPTGVSREFSFKQHFIVKGNPLPNV